MTTLPTWQNKVAEEFHYKRSSPKEGHPLSSSHYQFTKIVENWTSHLQYTAWQITKNKEAAEDIVQEAFLALWKQWAKMVPDNPVGWLIKVVTNLSARYLKQKHIQVRIHNTLRVEENATFWQVEEYLNAKEKNTLLNDVFRQLPAQQKIVLHLSKNIGLKREEIATCLQLSPNTVKVHLQRAMQFMKEHLSFIVILSMIFVINNILLRRSNTNDELRELYIPGNLTDNCIPEIIQNTAFPYPVTLMGIKEAATFLLKP